VLPHTLPHAMPPHLPPHTHTRLLRATHPTSQALTAASEHVEGQRPEEHLAEHVEAGQGLRGDGGSENDVRET